MFNSRAETNVVQAWGPGCRHHARGDAVVSDWVSNWPPPDLSARAAPEIRSWSKVSGGKPEVVLKAIRQGFVEWTQESAEGIVRGDAPSLPQ